MVRRLLSLCLALLAGPFSTVASANEAASEALKPLVARQKVILARAEKAGDNADVDALQSDLQQICQEYDKLLHRHPDFAPIYVAYGVLLMKVDMRKEGAALLLKANQLDGDIPLVKNQLGNYLAEEGRPLEAANYFLAAIKLAPNEPLYHYQLGTLLTVARDDFLKSGHWTRSSVDRAMHGAFQRAAELAPDNVGYAYRFGESFYDLDQPDWDQAASFWRSLEERVSQPLEKQTLTLHRANVLLKQNKTDEARTLLDSVTEPVLLKQKQKLIDQLPAPPAK